jgi:D-glycero-D-manno-heptose 1,7-bisphosphate phosphatase
VKIKAAFFDRDGTLIVDHDYLSQLEKVQLLLPAVAIAKMCQERGYKLFVVTNQSGVARGFFDEAFVQQTNNYVQELLIPHKIHIHKFYYCPHHPEIGPEKYKISCACRKPLPGMLQIAAREYNIDLSGSLMFGNTEVDLLAGRAAGCKTFDITKLLGLSIDEVAKLIF